MLWELIYGIIIGAVISIPFGGIGTLCLTLTLTKGFKYGISLAISIILGDAILVIFGLTFYNMLGHTLDKYEYLIKISTPVILLAIGIKILYGVYKKKLHKKNTTSDSINNIFIVFILSLFNPATLIIVITFFKILNIQRIFNNNMFIVGFIISSIILWIVYISLMLVIKNHSNIKFLYKANLYVGYILCLISFYLIVVNY